jgi:caa(3)-type oxidase subunit IV
MSHVTNSSAHKPEYHGHANYVLIWGILVVLMTVSLGIGALGHTTLALAIIFGVAIIKTLLVLGHFMHLKWEPKFVWMIFGFGVLCLFFLYFGVLPDLVNVYKLPL